jgi:glycine/serine hydroxymethyltransferase
MKEEEMKIIAKLIKESIINKDSPEKLQGFKSKVLELCKGFPIYR